MLQHRAITVTPYLPLIELLKNYFQITPQDDERKRREKVTGKVLTLDRSLEDTLPSLFFLLGISEPTSRRIPNTRAASTTRKRKEERGEQVGMSPSLRPTDVAVITGKIKDKAVVYLERVRVWFQTDAPPGDEATLAARCHGGVERGTAPQRYETGDGQWEESEKWRSSWDLHQPQDEAFRYLRKETKKRPYRIDPVEPALDWITDTVLEATELQEFFDLHALKRWYDRYTKPGTTSGIGTPKHGDYTSIDAYSDTLSPVAKKPCCHVVGKKERSTRGYIIEIHIGFFVSTFDELLAFPLNTFWQYHL